MSPGSCCPRCVRGANRRRMWGEAFAERRSGIDVLLNVGPTGCVIASMGEVLTPRILQAAGDRSGRIQTLFSADGDVSRELLTLAVR